MYISIVLLLWCNVFYIIYIYFDIFCSESDKTKAGEYVKDKLDDALRKKVDEIDDKRVLEEAEKERLEKMTKKQKEQHKQKSRGKIEYKKKKTLHQEERDIHEAYQLLLSEHSKRVKQRTKQKLATITALMKKPSLQTQIAGNDNQNENIGEKLQAWGQKGSKITKPDGKQGGWCLLSFSKLTRYLPQMSTIMRLIFTYILGLLKLFHDRTFAYCR